MCYAHLIGSESWFVQDYIMNRKAVLKEENTSSGYSVFCENLWRCIFLISALFCVCATYASVKSYWSKQIVSAWRKVCALFSLLCCFQRSIWWMEPQGISSISYSWLWPEIVLPLLTRTGSERLGYFQGKIQSEECSFLKLRISNDENFEWCSKNALSLLKSRS